MNSDGTATHWESAARGGAGRSDATDEALVRRSFWSHIGRFAARLPFAEDLVTAHYCAFDRTTPTHVRAALVGALAYFVMPHDAVPDLLPVIGFADDAAVLGAALRLVADHIAPEHRAAARLALDRAEHIR